MRKATILTLMGASFAMLLPITAAQAQATRTWVSGVGDDANPCSRTAPCKTFAGAISKTATNGEINCLDPGGFGAVTIGKSLTIDCHEVFASVLVSSTNGIIINFDGFAAGDTRRAVKLRNLNFNGLSTGLNGIRILGGTQSLGSEVTIEDCMIDGFQGAGGNAIEDVRSNGGKLFVLNTTMRNLAGNGIRSVPSAGGTTLNTHAENIRVYNASLAGVLIGSGGRGVVTNSVFFGNQDGVRAESTSGTTELVVDNSSMTGGGNGVTLGAGATTIRLSNNNISMNQTGISGQTFSFTNNRIAANVAAGTAPTTINPNPSNPTGQQ